MTGRPRDPAVDDAILRATLDLATEAGPRGVSIEAIAARSGVSKQTIYRRYGGKGEVMLDALAAFAVRRLPTPDTGSLRADLTTLLTATFAAQQEVAGTLNRAVAAEALQDEAFAGLLWERLIVQRRDEARRILARARERGEVTAPADREEFLVDLIFGQMWYRLLFDRSALTAEYAAQVADTVTTAAHMTIA